MAITMLPDGRVLLELLAERGLSFGSAETHVDERERTEQIIRAWVLEPRAEPESRGRHRPGAFRDGYTVSISAASGRQLSKYNDALGADFAIAFGSGTTGGGDAGPLARSLHRDLRAAFRRAGEQAAWRVADGGYAVVLSHYLEELRSFTGVEQQNAYEYEASGLIGIIDDERYLLLSTHETTRQLYIELLAERSALYNWYMDLARGGIARPRRA